MVRILAAAMAAAAPMALGCAIVERRAARALDEVTFGTDWQAEAEHGGYYQALATGIYEKYGLKVTLSAKAGRRSITRSFWPRAAWISTRRRIPLSVSTLCSSRFRWSRSRRSFRKDPSVLMAHPGVGNDSLAAMKGKPILISADTRVGYWLFLKAKFGYTDSQIRPYNFNMTSFLADKNAVQQGYLTSEPFLIEKQGGQKPLVFLLADNGYSSYGSLIETSQKLIDTKPDLVQRFVNASIEGWYSYLYGDPAPANKLIKQDNPEETDDLLAYAREMMKSRGVVDSGDSQSQGIGAMTDARWQDFFAVMSGEALYPKDLDWKKAYTARFVNQRVGMAAKPQ